LVKLDGVGSSGFVLPVVMSLRAWTGSRPWNPAYSRTPPAVASATATPEIPPDATSSADLGQDLREHEVPDGDAHGERGEGAKVLH